MKRALALALAAAALFSLAAAGIAVSKDPGTKPEDRVYGGARDEGLFSGSGGIQFPPRDSSVDAHADQASGKTYGTFRIGRNADAFFLLEARITCVSAVGNKALLGGIITVDNSVGQQVPGEDFLWYVIDNGGPGGTTRDRVSAVWRDANGSLGQGAFPGAFPAGWPNVCPTPDAAIAADTVVGTRDATAGDFVVIDAP